MLGLVPDPQTSTASSQRAQAPMCKVHVQVYPLCSWNHWPCEQLLDWLVQGGSDRFVTHITWAGVDITAMSLSTPLQQGRS